MLTNSDSGKSEATSGEVDALIVGAGLSGLYMLYRLRNQGLSVSVYEAGEGVGGTWFWNRYPGARCDTESIQYSYSFSEELQQEWSWSHKYAPQEEILRYINHVADRFDLRRNVRLNTRVERAAFNEATGRWLVTTAAGDTVSAGLLIMATGNLSVPLYPRLPGTERFGGRTYHTSAWPQEGVDFTGRNVAVIGTGSSGVQVIPKIGEQAKTLTVFQRTPNFILPARNRPMAKEIEKEWKENYAARRAIARSTRMGSVFNFGTRSALEVSAEERDRAFQERWDQGGGDFLFTFNDLFSNEEANSHACEFYARRIAEKVNDPEVAETLTPRDYPFGAKRICLDTNYFETFNKPNVKLVDLRKTPIEEVRETGLTTSAEEFQFDDIVFATGFDAITGALLATDIRGRGDRSLRDEWAAGPINYLGVMVHGFPNMFTVTGPGSPSVLGNVATNLEQHVGWISDLVQSMRTRGQAVVEPTKEAQDSWVRHVNELSKKTFFPRAASWYLGANVPGKPRVFMPYSGGVGTYRELCNEIVRKDYEGFVFDSSRAEPQSQSAA